MDFVKKDSELVVVRKETAQRKGKANLNDSYWLIEVVLLDCNGFVQFQNKRQLNNNPFSIIRTAEHAALCSQLNILCSK